MPFIVCSESLRPSPASWGLGRVRCTSQTTHSQRTSLAPDGFPFRVQKAPPAQTGPLLPTPPPVTDLLPVPHRWGHSRHPLGWAPFWRTKRDPHRICSSSAHHNPSLRALWEPPQPQDSPSPKVLPRLPQAPPKALLEQPPALPLPDPSSGLRTLGPTPNCGVSSSTHLRPRLGCLHPKRPSTTSSHQGLLHCCPHHTRVWGNPSWGPPSCTHRLPSPGPHSFPRELHCQVRCC